MFASIAHRYDLLNRVLSFRRDVTWRRIAVAGGQIPPGARVLDLCAGTGDVAMEVLRQVPTARVVAVDNCEPMLVRGVRKAGGPGGAQRLCFVAAPAEQLPFADAIFDCALVAFGVRNIADQRRGLAEMARVVKPGGHGVILEFATPTSPLFGALYRWYSHRLLPWIGGLVSGNRAAYAYLPASVDGFLSPTDLTVLMEEVGFAEVMVRSLTFGIVTIHRGRRAGPRG
jgi:demethylmenaquinone methyltransferase / 2-methoxy-6-polyprenyl-1,4-benzoquinol methylase